MKPLSVGVDSEKETALLAKIFALEIKKVLFGQKKASIVGFTGILGAGKTTFIRYLAKTLGIREKILSPSFLIFKKYHFFLNPKSLSHRQAGKILNQKFALMHVDCYRLTKPRELTVLGFKNDLESPRNFIVIEWAEKIKRILPKKMVWIHIKIASKNARVFEFH